MKNSGIIGRSKQAEKMGQSNYLVLCTMRDEGPYLLEWIAYHRAIGFTEFLIYTNDCRDGTDLLLDRLAQNGEVTHERTKVLKRGPQKSAYKSAMQHSSYKSADWVFAADVDEFLNIRLGEGRVEELLAQFPNAEAIPVCWRLFSNNSIEGFIDGFTLEALTDAEPDTPGSNDVGRFVKSLFRPIPEITRIGSHAPVYGEKYETKVRWGAGWREKNVDFNPRRPKEKFGYEFAQVNHYAVRTIDTFLLKRDRGDVNFMKDRLEVQYWERWCRGGTSDKSILKHLPAMQVEYERLIKDPIVKHLQEGAIAFHKNRLDELLASDEYKKIKLELLDISQPKKSAEMRHSSNTATQELTMKAPGRHQNRLRMLEMMPKGGRCAEIGVWNGGFSAAILDVTAPSELVLIDPWDLLAEQTKDEWTHKSHEDAKIMQEMYDNVSSLYGNLDNVEIRKGFSAEVLLSYPDHYFDWVYIDGNHTYDYVKKDIELSFKKVRPGGIIAGDDFFWKRNDRMHVREAVLDAMRDQGMTNRPARIGQQYMITTSA